MLMFYKLNRQFPGLIDGGGYNRHGLVAPDFSQHNKAGIVFCQGDNIRVLRAQGQVSFPANRYRSVFGFRRPFADRYRNRG